MKGRCGPDAILCLALLLSPALALGDGEPGAAGGRTSRISDDAVPLVRPEAFPDRPRPLIEIGNPFLGTGNLSRGIRMPGGAVWQPSLIAFGTLRTALQSFDSGQGPEHEWGNRLDLFGNLQLTGTERVLVGIRPLERPGTLAGYRWTEGERGFFDDRNAELQTLFFEGELAELFPSLDRDDSASMDLGFAVGRQPLRPQEGVLMADSVDALGLIRNTLLPSGGSDLQVTAVWGWNQIHRADFLRRDGQMLFGLFGAADYPSRTVRVDAVWALDRDGATDGLFWGVSSVQRIGHTNATLRALGSHALEEESSAVSDGYLLMAELSWTLPWTDDLMYVNAFWGIERFSSAARGPGLGGPLARVGLLYAPIGLGGYGAPLDASGHRSVGGAGGYQKFMSDTRRQLVLEAAVQHMTDDGTTEGAMGMRLRQALGRRFVLQLDGFGVWREGEQVRWGARLETLVQF